MKSWQDAIHFSLLGLVFSLCLSLQGCAESAVSREAERNVDASYVHSDNSLREASYQNSSQTAKGIVAGGAGGALLGSSTGLGVFPAVAGGAILGGAFGRYIDNYSTLADKLRNRGAKVFHIGDQIMIVLHSDDLFEDNTSYLLPSAYSTLNLVVFLINCYPNMAVSVTAFTGRTPCTPVALALSKAQANSIVKYMWRRGVNTRLLYAVGADGSHLVSRSCGYSSWSEGENYRVEITLEALPV